MRHFISDLVHAFRQWRARPGLWAAIIVTLALGIGANTAVFSVIHSLLLKPLPFADAERLVMVYNTYPKSDLPFAGTSIPDYLDRKEGAPSLEDLAILNAQSLNLTLGEARALETLGALPGGTPSRLISTDIAACTFARRPSTDHHGGLLLVNVTISRVTNGSAETLRIAQQLKVEEVR